ncbi:uncharacterized protein K452DRAFT_310324 [Aplosporella prunicola CBS 121167]|uniref:Nitrogen permease regulator 2 n=1 Tax=Aplosporella prunicola CBS 121167 TaxID=1176127 RepID=A0A6A6B766_9PEZI|nr:uncharacterized protein K452DRAFT_310324 [Aplosporella prunicola CBS 121167]KAF2139959.1 hypothetical protein K452DRAFT_310324 [Aplosporella prunicola CBS 121167]
MIKSIFYTRFHPEKGSRVVHQVPDGSIIPSTKPCALFEPLFDFSSISEYVIPRQEFCDRLVTVCCNRYRVIGYPVCINDESKYERNQFIFNFAFVVEEDLLDWNSFASVVRKLGKLLRNLEEQGSFLSKEEAGDVLGFGDMGKGQAGQKKSQRPDSMAESIESFGLDKLSLDTEDTDVEESGPVSKVYALCEMILEDLNNYCECMFPIDDSNIINLKLFPTRLPPAPVHAWHVPLLTIDLEMYTAPSSMNPHTFSSRCATLSSDLTLTRILPFIDGINSVSYISQLADTDLSLTRKAVQHLVYYECVILLDIFQFGAMYAPTPLIAHFFMDEAAIAECARYVRIPRFLDTSVGDATSIFPLTETKTENAAGEPVTAAGLGRGHSRNPSAGSVRYAPPTAAASTTGSPTQRPQRSSTISTQASAGFANLILAPNQPSISAETLILLYSSLRQGVTLRTWVMENQALLAHIDVRRLVTFGVIKGFLYRVHKYAITTSAGALAGTTARYDGFDHLHGIRYRGGDVKHQSVYVPSEEGDGSVGGRELPLARYLDGLHCFDEICTELGMGEREVVAKMRKGFSDVLIVNR